MRSLFKYIERTFTVLVLFLSSNALVSLFRKQSGYVFSVVEGDQLQQAMWSSIYAAVLLLLVFQWKRVLRVTLREKFLLMLLALAVVSVFWSEVAPLTFRRAIALTGTTLFGVYLAVRYSLDELLRLLGWALGLAAVLSLVFVLVVPTYGIATGIHEGLWQGIYSHKNQMGRAMSISSIVFLLLACSSRSRRWLLWAGCVLSIGLVVASNSLTAMLVVLFILAGLPFYRLLNLRNNLDISLFCFAVLAAGGIAIGILSNMDLLLGVSGRDTTLTGRTELWQNVVSAATERPWLGYGYRGFWAGWEGPSAGLRRVLGWRPGHAHNGYLDLWLELGFLGVALFAFNAMGNVRRAVAWMRNRRATFSRWPLTWIILILFYNMAETSFLQPNSLMWIVYVAVSMALVSQHNSAQVSVGGIPREQMRSRHVW